MAAHSARRCVVDDDLFLRARSGVGQLGERLLVRGKLPALGRAHPPGFPPRGDDQPAGRAPPGSRMPSRCATRRIQTVCSTSSASPALSPAARATCHSSGLSSVTIWPSASSLPCLAALTRPAMRAPRSGWLGAARAVRPCGHPPRSRPRQPQCCRAATARSVAVSRRRGSSSPQAGSAAPSSSDPAMCAASSGAENDVPLQTAKPPE